jgi:molybdopterin/thiamine biosynthesis adenylyltransferase
MEFDRYSRHDIFYSQEQKSMMRKGSILLAGCGAGSPVAVHLARLGICSEGEMIMADPDKVDASNLNRQSYFDSHIGENKAVALAQYIRAHNPETQIKVVPEGITPMNVDTLINKVDVVLEMVDVSQPAIISTIHRIAKLHQKPVVTGLDIGYGAISYVFDYKDPSSMTWHEFLGIPMTMSDEQIGNLASMALTAQLMIGPVEKEFSDDTEAKKYYDHWFDQKETMDQLGLKLSPDGFIVAASVIENALSFVPQTDTAASTLGLLHSLQVSKLLTGLPVKHAPQAVQLNILNLI